MDLLFCDVCNESVPQKDLETGAAVRRKGHVVCASCEGAMSPPDKGASKPAAAASAASKPGAMSGAAVGAAAGSGAAAGAHAGAAAPASQRAGTQASAPAARGGVLGGVGVALGAAGLAAALAGGMMQRDALAEEAQQRADDLGALRASLQDGTGRLEESLEGHLQTLQQDLVRLTEESTGLRERLETEARAERTRTDGLRDDLGELGQRLTSIEALRDELQRVELEVQRFGRFTADLHEQQLRLGERLESVRADVGSVRELASVDVGALLTPGAQTEPVDERPAWLDFVGDLRSQSASVRWQAVQSIGQSGDPAAAEHLAPMLKDPDLFVRMASARNLGDLGAPLGIPALIDALEDPEESVRESAVVSLRAMTEKDFRFDPSGKESERSKAVSRWRDWWGDAKDELLGEEGGASNP